MQSDKFINIAFSTDNLDKYYHRSSIYQSIVNSLINFRGDLLDIGCGKMPYKDFIIKNSSINTYTGLDIAESLTYEENIKPDYTWDGVTMPFANNTFQTTFATEVLEHCPEPKDILNEIFRVMKNGGCFFFTVPFLWNLHEVPHDEYRYTPFALKRMLEETGFKSIEITATGGWHASMAQMLGLWVRRSAIGNRKRKLLSFILKPVIKYLISKDKKTANEFTEGQMITGLYGTAYK